MNKKQASYYGVLTLLLFIAEILIGTVFNHVFWVRSYLGDVLIIPLLYCLVRIFVQNRFPRLMPFLICCIGFIAETAQYFRLSDRLGFARGSLMSILIGTSFSGIDMICYILGMFLIYAVLFLKSERSFYIS